MAKEKKLSLPGLPTVYATDVLKVGDIGALVVYTVTTPVSTTVDGIKTTKNEIIMSSVNIRFSPADSPVDSATKRKLTTSMPALLDLYLGGGTDVAPATVIVGPIGYEFYQNDGMGMVIVKLKIGDVNVAEAHYLGDKPLADATPSQLVYPATVGSVPPTLSNIVKANLKLILNKELYGV